MKTGFTEKFRSLLRSALQYFLQGILVLAPAAITAWLVITLFAFIDSILPNIIYTLFPKAIPVNEDGSQKQFPGLGFIIVILLVFFIGWLSSLFIFSRLLALLDKGLERTPGIKFIYSSVKDFMQAFAGNKRKFDKPVLVSVDSVDVWRIGFITKKDLSRIGMADHVAVYVPLAYAVTGVTYIVPKKQVMPLEGLSAAEAMKFAVTGGVTEVHEDHHPKIN